MLCSEYGGDTALSAEGTCVSTLLSLLTIPVMLSLLG
jgi:predicted permease